MNASEKGAPQEEGASQKEASQEASQKEGGEQIGAPRGFFGKASGSCRKNFGQASTSQKALILGLLAFEGVACASICGIAYLGVEVVRNALK